MANDSLITVIVPTHNVAQYIESCICSLLSQTYKKLEIIIIDDGSTDGTVDIIRTYEKKDSRVRGYYKESTGVSDTRNIGIEKASGEYIGFCDADDTVECSMFEILHANAVTYKADISHCGYKMVFPNRIDYYYNTNQTIVQNHERGLIDIIENRLVEPSVWNKLFRAELIKDLRFNTNIRIYEDLLFCVHAFSKSQVAVFLDKPLYNYTKREDSTSTSATTTFHITDPIYVADDIYQHYHGVPSLSTICSSKLIANCINSYKAIILSKDSSHKTYKQFVRDRLRNCSGVLREVPIHLRVKALLVQYFPSIYSTIYRFYFRVLSRNKISTT